MLVANTTTLELAGVKDFSYIVIMEEQHHGQRIWGWTVEGKRAGKWGPLSKGGSIGHKRIISCADLNPSSSEADPHEPEQQATGKEARRSHDPPDPPPRPDDVLFTECGRANSWQVKADGTVRTNVASASAADAEGRERCLTLDGPAQRFQFLSAKPCIEQHDADADSGSAGRASPQQRWKFPWLPGQPALAFAGPAKMCVQINGDTPWTGEAKKTRLAT